MVYKEKSMTHRKSETYMNFPLVDAVLTVPYLSYVSLFKVDLVGNSNLCSNGRLSNGFINKSERSHLSLE